LLNLTVRFVDAAELSRYWLACEPLIARGLEPGEGEADASHLLADLQEQRAYLIVGLDIGSVVRVAMVVQFLAYPNYKVAHVYSIGGRGVIESTQHWATIKAWMKQHGAIKVQGACKPSRARLWQKLGFTDTYHLVRQDL
jgi:hypothetical protein